MNKQAKANGGRGIEWTDYTSNPIAGCFHACEWQMPNGEWANCYAEDVANKFGMHAYPEGFEHHYWRPDEVKQWKSLKPGERVFVGSMADVFGHWVPAEQIQFVLDRIALYPQNVFQLLTKNFTRVLQFDIPKNAWVGASSPPDKMWNKPLSAKQKEAWLRRTLNGLAATRAKGVITWMSAEPLTFPLARYLWDISTVNEFAPIDWIVIGAASDGPKLIAPDETYVRDVVDFCDMDFNNVPVFFKGNMRSLKWAADNWREEFPQAVPV
jgi:protein gp37